MINIFSRFNIKGNASLDNNVSLLLGMFLFFLFVTGYAVAVFQQFDSYQVIIVALFFLLLLSAGILLFNKDLVKIDSIWSIKNLFASCILLLIIIYYASPPGSWVHGFFPYFPVARSESLLEINRDTSYHVALINSILNFGYPSIAQNDNPFTAYHVLSYYVDAFIIKIAGLNPFDAYGMLFFFQASAFTVAVITFIARITRGLPSYIFWLSVFVLPFFIIHWHAVLSKPLWFVSILLLLTAPNVFDLLKKDRVDVGNILFLFVIVCLISLGKVSSGFMYAVFIGFFLLLKDFKRATPYVLGGAWLTFFIGYYLLFYGSWGGDSSGSMALPSLSAIAESFKDVRLEIVYIYISILLFFAVVFRNKTCFKLFGASLFSLVVLVVLVTTVTSFGRSDVFYFIYGFHSVLILFLVQGGLDIIKAGTKKEFVYLGGINAILDKYSFALIVFLFSVFLIFNIDRVKDRVLSLNIQPYEQLNEVLDEDVSLKRILTNNANLSVFSEKGELVRLRDALKRFMDEKSITVNNTLLYIPKEIYEGELSKYQTDQNFKGLFVYAITEVPLLHGLRILRKGYGYADYDENALWREKDDFDTKYACRFNKNIITLENWDSAEFSLIKCNEGNSRPS
jgi:hypothetical protein